MKVSLLIIILAVFVSCAGQQSPGEFEGNSDVGDVQLEGSAAFDADSGEVIWSYDTVREFETVNGAKGRGGALDASGPVVVDGWVYVASGYSKWGGLPGNVLLGFAPKDTTK